MNRQTYPQMDASQLKIQGHEIHEATGFHKNWSAGIRFFLLCLGADDLTDLSQLLDLVDEHNCLVSAIEIDLQKAAASQQNDVGSELQEAVQTFSQTKQKILKAIAQHSVQNSADSINQARDPISIAVNTTQNVYSGLMRKSCYLAIQAERLTSTSTATATISETTTRSYKQSLRNDKSALKRRLPASIHV